MADVPVRLVLYIELDWSQLQAYYRGEMPRVAAFSEEGRRVVLPSSSLRPFLSQAGVRGWFELIYERDTRRILSLTVLEQQEKPGP